MSGVWKSYRRRSGLITTFSPEDVARYYNTAQDPITIATNRASELYNGNTSNNNNNNSRANELYISNSNGASELENINHNHRANELYSNNNNNNNISTNTANELPSDKTNRANELSVNNHHNRTSPIPPHDTHPTSPSSPASHKRKHDGAFTPEEQERLKRRSREYTPEGIAIMVEASKELQPTEEDFQALFATDDDYDPVTHDFAAAEQEYQNDQKERDEAAAAALLQAELELRDEKQAARNEANAAEFNWWTKWEEDRKALTEKERAECEAVAFADEYKQRQVLVQEGLYPDNFPPIIDPTILKGPVFATKNEETSYFRELWRACHKNMERDEALLSLEEKTERGYEIEHSANCIDWWLEQAERCEANFQTATDPVEQQYWINKKTEIQYTIACDYSKANMMKQLVEDVRIKWRIQVDDRKAAEEARIQADKDAEEAELRAREEELAREEAERLERERKEREPSGLEMQRQRLFPFINPLAEDWNRKVDSILATTNMRQVIGQSADKVNITRIDIAKIVGGSGYRSSDPSGWLNDEIVNAFYANLVAALNDKDGYVKGPDNIPRFVAYATAWYDTVKDKGVKGIARWSGRKGIKGDKLLQCERIFFPINTGNHWTLIAISGKHRTIEYLDSMDGLGGPRKSTRYHKIGRDWLEMELGNKYVADDWSEMEKRSSQQNNGSDCGVFACLNGLALALGMQSPTEEFGPENMPDARRVMIAMLSNGGFVGDFAI